MKKKTTLFARSSIWLDGRCFDINKRFCHQIDVDCCVCLLNLMIKLKLCDKTNKNSRNNRKFIHTNAWISNTGKKNLKNHINSN